MEDPSPRLDLVRLTGSLFGAVGLFLAFLVFRANRLAPGQGMKAWEVLPAWAVVGIAAVFAALPVLSLAGSRKARILQILLESGTLLALLFLAGAGAELLHGRDNPYARVSMGAGFWIMLAACFVHLNQSFVSATLPKTARFASVFLIISGATGLFLFGHMDSLSLMQEYANREDRFFREVADHLFITFASVGASSLLGIPLGIIASRNSRLSKHVFSVLNLVQTIPSLALFGLLIAPLALLAENVALARDLGIQGIGWAPAVIALTLYALLPIVRNTSTGLESLPGSMIEAGRGMGMNQAQLLVRVELPMALPVILNGLRIATVQNIGNTAVAALIGAGGLGVFIFQGLGQAALDLVLLGALPTILIAVVADFLMQLFIVATRPRGLATSR